MYKFLCGSPLLGFSRAEHQSLRSRDDVQRKNMRLDLPAWGLELHRICGFFPSFTKPLQVHTVALALEFMQHCLHAEITPKLTRTLKFHIPYHQQYPGEPLVFTHQPSPWTNGTYSIMTLQFFHLRSERNLSFFFLMLENGEKGL